MVNGEAIVDERQQMERAALINSIDCDCRFLRFFDWAHSFELAFTGFIHKVNHIFGIAGSSIFDLLSSDVEFESWIPFDMNLILDFLLLWEINSCDEIGRVLLFERSCELFVLGCEFDAVPASGRVVLNKDILVLLQSWVIVLVVQYDDVGIFDLLFLF